MNPFPYVLSIFTGSRYKTKIVWSKSSWTHNIFRFYELIFWRRVGIRAEAASFFDKDGNQRQEAFTFEAQCALFETYIRYKLNQFPKLKLVKIELPVLAYAGIKSFPKSQYNKQPYLFAVAFDAASGATTSASSTDKTLSQTCTGSDLVVFMATYYNPGGGDTLSYLYNSVAMSEATSGTNSGIQCRLSYLVNPATGAHNLELTSNNNRPMILAGASYTGVDQTNPIDSGSAVFAAQTSGTTVTVSTTVTGSNCWLVLAGINARAMQPQTGATERVDGNSGDQLIGMYDSGTTVGTGTQGFDVSTSSWDPTWGSCMIAIAPVGSGGTKSHLLGLLGIGV